MIVTTKELFRHAYGKYAVGAYNINNLEQTVGLFRGNLGKIEDRTRSPANPAASAPFIIQISRGARSYTDKRFLEAMIRTADEVFPEAIFAVHLDHGTEEVCYDCIESGFYSSVMIDASHEPLEKNIEITRRVVERAHAKGIVVEAELGQLGGVEEDVVGSVCLTDAGRGGRVRRARAAATRWPWPSAPRTGPTSSAGSQGLHLDRLAEIQKALPKGFPLVMHGSSSVPKEWVDRINAAGGKMKDTSGVRRGPVPAGRQAGRLQGEHRHRRPAGVVRHPPRGVPRRSGELRPPPAGQGLHGQPTPTTSSTRTRSSARPASWKPCGGRSRR